MRLARPGQGPRATTTSGPRGAVWRATPPTPPHEDRSAEAKPWRAIRANRPALLEPLPESVSLSTYQRRCSLVMWFVGLALTMLLHSYGVSTPRINRLRWSPSLRAARR